MRNQTSDNLADLINTAPIKYVLKKFKAFDLRYTKKILTDFFFVYEGEVVQAYCVNKQWYCKY